MVYATYRRGYKSGGFNSGAFNATDFEEFQPEYLTDVELGTKNNWTILGVPGRTNFDVYYGWYQDVQKNDLVAIEQEVNVAPPPNPPDIIIEPEGFSALTFNAARATIKGLEFQSTFIPDDNFQVNVFYSYTDATYSSVRAAAGDSRRPDRLADAAQSGESCGQRVCLHAEKQARHHTALPHS
jgi:iron complex outermembrane receptor protein